MEREEFGEEVSEIFFIKKNDLGFLSSVRFGSVKIVSGAIAMIA